MKIDRDMEFTYTVLRNGFMVKEEGSVWDFDNGILDPTLDDVINAVENAVKGAGEELMSISIGDESIFFNKIAL